MMRFFLSTNSFSRTIDFYFLIIIPNSVSSVLDLLLEPLELPVFIINVIYYITHIIAIFFIYIIYYGIKIIQMIVLWHGILIFFLLNIIIKYNLIFNVILILVYLGGGGE